MTPRQGLDTPAAPCAGDGVVHRLAAAPPRRGTVLLLSSGKARSMADPTPDARLLHLLADDLSTRGFDCVNPALPLRQDGLTADDGELVRLRADLAERALAEIEPAEPVALVAISLGVLSALALAERPEVARGIDALVLLSGMVERPVAPRGRIRSVDLVYGARDHVGYLSPGETEVRDVRGPRDYGPVCQRHLVLGPLQESAVHILPGAGHALERATAGGPDHGPARALLSQIIPERLGVRPHSGVREPLATEHQR